MDPKLKIELLTSLAALRMIMNEIADHLGDGMETDVHKGLIIINSLIEKIEGA